MKTTEFLNGVLLVTFLSLFLTLPALAANDIGGAAASSPKPSAQLIKQLEAAKKADWNAALDPTVSPTRQETFLNQMNKADRASKEISHGFEVPQNDISDALWMPPRHISPEERAQLIEQLEQAKQQDEQNEQQMLTDLSWGRSAAPIDTVTFDRRQHQIDGVVKDLEIDAPVHWSAIKAALVVPASPY